jgi:hypothetical protein
MPSIALPNTLARTINPAGNGAIFSNPNPLLR